MYFVSAVLFVYGTVTPAHALGLGELRVLSGLGQPLKANVMLIGAGLDDLSHSCIRAKVATTEGGFIAQATVVVSQIAQNKIVSISTGVSLNEPAIKITIDIHCETQLHRDFLALLDPVEFLPAISKNLQTYGQKENTVADGMEGGMPVAAKSPETISAPLKNTKREKLAIRQNNDQAINSGQVAASAKKTGKLKREKLPKDVLKLSDENAVGPHGLKISDTLSAPLEQQIADNMLELRAAQRQMAAILRDENPIQLADNEQTLEQKKIQKLLSDFAQLKNQSRIDKANLDEIQKNSYSRDWVAGLASLVLLSFLIILGLFIYVRRLQKRSESAWWDQGLEKKEAERRRTIEEMVDNVQASYEPSNAEIETIVPEKHPLTSLTAPVDEIQGQSPVVDTAPQIFQSSLPARTPTLEETNSSTFNFFSSRGTSVKVEEISDITQEAEFWMSVNDPQRAIEILDEQANIEHPDSPVPWLYLLDLYRLVNDKPKYDNLRDRFVSFFNANVPEFETELQHKGVLQLEDYPHLIERICSSWNGNEIIPFLESLLVDDRDGKRTGFDLPVYRDILLLISIAHELERLAAIEGPVSSGRKEFGKSISNESLADSSSDLDLGMIEFEVIDFPKIKPFKE